MINKIAITGPESTGKSQLAEQLAIHFETVFVPEFARDYLLNIGKEYHVEDVINIAKGQIASENHWMDAANKRLFCDTDLINIKIWLEHKFGQCPKWIIDQINKNTYDLYLLMDIDLPWEEDALRENPDQRAYFLSKFKAELDRIGANYQLISGKGNERLKRAIDVVERL